jgi:hypothetical protein
MPAVACACWDAPGDLEHALEVFVQWNPGFLLGTGITEGPETELSAEHGGVRYIWILDGRGAIWLNAGYRTQEGDGRPLPPAYRADPLAPPLAEVLDCLAQRRARVHPELSAPVQAILERRRPDGTFVGDIAGELWRILESAVPAECWSTDTEVRAALEVLFQSHRELGWSTKVSAGFEPVHTGDQLVVTAQGPARVRGAFRYWWIEDTRRTQTHCSLTRRLVYLKDTSGGCNPGFDAFRRLPLTWYPGTGTDGDPDGVNRVNSHVVNIAAETSRTHYHPDPPPGGGKPQCELYLVLDPATYSLETSGRRPWLYIYPDVEDLRRIEHHPLAPGMLVVIPPNTGHRGVDVFVNVVTLPGFKPRNEVYLDTAVRLATSGRGPFTPGFA